MDLNRIFTTQRTGSHAPRVVSRTDFQRDFDRIIFSSAFRRLQNKTQVFPLPGSVFVHNRLTHSLEVSSVGRSLGALAGEFILSEYDRDLTDEARSFYRDSLSNVVAAASLCHDVGNPAFGHSGEDAIASFFEKNESQLKQHFKPKEWADLVNFEGNANAVRVLTQQQNGKDAGGAKLTYTTLASIAKYPCEAVAKNKKVVHRKKFGFFQSEKAIFEDIASGVELPKESSEPLIYKRNPFVWLVEAADDICYNIIDMEDAHRLGIVSSADCENLFTDLIKSVDNARDNKAVKQKLTLIKNANERISFLRAKAINSLITKSLELYSQDFPNVLAGTLEQPLLSKFKDESQALRDIESFSIEKIYGHRSVVEIENAGYNVMYELLSHFVPPVLKDVADRKSYDRKALQLLPEQFTYDHLPLYNRVLGVIDFVSGMTDNYATDLYRKIKGIEIGMSV